MPALQRRTTDKPLRQHGIEIICGLCRGKGWMPPAMLDAAKARVAQECPIVPTGRAYVGSSGG
ncbi:MAG TPA: hypothetical protein VHW23_29210 [Kofleriaceae bacterium]|jgi:hypothetical protein|nr:hypothetical protein [Kofleriaceae bacterium]